MTDHVTGAQVVGASITSVTIALLGVPHLALVWGFAGAGIAAVFSPPESPMRGIAIVLAAGFAGAAGGSAAAEYVAGAAQRAGSLLVVCSLIAGFGARPILGRAVDVAVGLIGRFGAGSGGGGGQGGAGNAGGNGPSNGGPGSAQ